MTQHEMYERLDQEALAEELAEAAMIANLPRSTATNAYERCEELCQAILAEPRRYDQSDWLSHGIWRMSKLFLIHGDNAPDCGTVACLAGWVVALNGELHHTTDKIPRRAAEILGFRYDRNIHEEVNTDIWNTDIRPIRELFDDDLIAYTDDESLPAHGTLEYAQLGVKKLRQFMATHEARLKAKAV